MSIPERAAYHRALRDLRLKCPVCHVSLSVVGGVSTAVFFFRCSHCDFDRRVEDMGVLECSACDGLALNDYLCKGCRS